MDRLFFIVIVTSLSVAVLLFFPIYIKTDMHYDMNGRKFGFYISAYGVIKLLGGYIATYQGGLAVHVSDKKAILIPYSDLNNERKRFSVIRTFRLKTLNLTVETGAEYLIGISFFQSLFRIIFFVLGGKKEKIENNLWLTDGDVLRVSIDFTVRLNVYILLKNLIKYLKARWKELWLKKIKKSTI